MDDSTVDSQVDLDVLAAPGPVALAQRGQYADRGEQTRQDVDEGHPDFGRVVGVGAGDAHQPAERLDQQVIAGEFAARARSECRDAAVHQSGVSPPNGGLVQAEPCHRPGAEVLYQNISTLGEASRHLQVRTVAQVEHDAALVAVDAEEVGAFVIDERRSPHSGVVALGSFDLDDVGTQVTEGHGAKRSGQYPGEIDDPQRGKRRAPIRHLPTTSKAISAELFMAASAVVAAPDQIRRACGAISAARPSSCATVRLLIG